MSRPCSDLSYGSRMHLLYAEFHIPGRAKWYVPLGRSKLLSTTTADLTPYLASSSACRAPAWWMAGYTQAEGVRRRLSSWYSSPLVVLSCAYPLRHIAFATDSAPFKINAGLIIRRIDRGIISHGPSPTGLGRDMVCTCQGPPCPTNILLS